MGRALDPRGKGATLAPRDSRCDLNVRLKAMLRGHDRRSRHTHWKRYRSVKEIPLCLFPNSLRCQTGEVPKVGSPEAGQESLRVRLQQGVELDPLVGPRLIVAICSTDVVAEGESEDRLH